MNEQNDAERKLALVTPEKRDRFIKALQSIDPRHDLLEPGAECEDCRSTVIAEGSPYCFECAWKILDELPDLLNELTS